MSSRESVTCGAMVMLTVIFLLDNGAVATEETAMFGKEFLDPEQTVRLRWNQPTNDNGKMMMEFELTVPSLGWGGLGFSRTGGMDGADMFIASMSPTGEIMGLDTHGEGHSVLRDASQDYTLLNLVQDKTEKRMIIRFSRAMDTCDISEDFLITPSDTVSVIYAFGDQPFNESDPWGNYHGDDKRGIKSLRFLGREDSATVEARKKADQPGVSVVNIGIPPTEIPAQQNAYTCLIIPAPQLKDAKQQIIGFDARVSKGNDRYLHHMIIYPCQYKASDAHLYQDYMTRYPQGADCFQHSWQLVQCSDFLAVWGNGGRGISFPDDSGYPVPEQGDLPPAYYRLEIHYYNPGKITGIMDSSGIELYVTKNLRPHDVGLLMIGHDVHHSIVIPPGVDSMTSVSHCPSTCTESGLPPEGIKVMAAILHAHQRGRRIRIRQWRQGKEMEPLATDSNFKFDYQTFHTFPDGQKKLMPGDQLTVECDYNSIGHNTTTIGGYRTNNEMCLSYLLVHPFTPNVIATCLSTPNVTELHTLLRLPPKARVTGRFDAFHPVVVPSGKQPSPNNEKLEDCLNRNPWTTSDINQLAMFYKTGEKFTRCRSGSRDNLLARGIPSENLVHNGTQVRAQYPNTDPWIPPARECARKS